MLKIRFIQNSQDKIFTLFFSSIVHLQIQSNSELQTILDTRVSLKIQTQLYYSMVEI